MNREELRKQIKQIAKDPDARRCKFCGRKSLFVSVPTHNWLCDIKCIICGGTIEKDVKTIPNTYH